MIKNPLLFVHPLTQRALITLALALVLGASLASCGSSGGGCKSNADCGDTQFCKFSDNSCGTGGGSCSDRPTTCPGDSPLVCTCEKLTFFNECWADAAGQSVASPGECA